MVTLRFPASGAADLFDLVGGSMSARGLTSTPSDSDIGPHRIPRYHQGSDSRVAPSLSELEWIDK